MENVRLTRATQSRPSARNIYFAVKVEITKFTHGQFCPIIMKGVALAYLQVEALHSKGSIRLLLLQSYRASKVSDNLSFTD